MKDLETKNQTSPSPSDSITQTRLIGKRQEETFQINGFLVWHKLIPPFVIYELTYMKILEYCEPHIRVSEYDIWCKKGANNVGNYRIQNGSGLEGAPGN